MTEALSRSPLERLSIWKAAKRERKQFVRIQSDIAELADKNRIRVAIFGENCVAYKRYDRDTGEFIHVSPNGEEINVYDLEGWLYYKPQLEEAIKREGDGLKRHSDEIDLFEIGQYHNLHSRG